MDVDNIEMRRNVCHIKLGECFSAELKAFLDNKTKASMISTEYIVAPLMTAVSHLMGRAEVHALGTYENGIAMASFIIGDVGSGKTTALSMIQGCLEKIDDALFIDQLERKSLNAATIEALVHHLKAKDTIISFYDEANMLLSMFGRYTSGGTGYDRAIINTLMNAPSVFRRDLKSEKTAVMIEPRWNMCGGAHLNEILPMYNDKEKLGYDDGLSYRIMFNFPQEKLEYRSKDCKNLEPNQYCLESILYFIRAFHKNKVIYKFDNKAENRFDEIYDALRTCSSDAYLKSTVIKAFCNKSTAPIVQFCAMFQALDNAFSYVSTELRGEVNFDKETVAKIYKYLKDSKATLDGLKIIKLETVNRAYELWNYFTKYKLIFAGFPVDWEGTSDKNAVEIMQLILKDLKTEVLNEVDEYESNKIKIFNKIMMNENLTVSVGDISQVYKKKVDIVRDCCCTLEKLKLGECIWRNGNKDAAGKSKGPKTDVIEYLKKITIESLSKNLELQIDMQKLGVSYNILTTKYDEYIMNDITIKPTKISKRKAEEQNAKTIAKKQKSVIDDEKESKDSNDSSNSSLPFDAADC